MPRVPHGGGRHVPQRTCVGCRAVVAQGDLVRAVVDDAGRLRFDGLQHVRLPQGGPAHLAAKDEGDRQRAAHNARSSHDAGSSNRLRRKPGRGVYVHQQASCVQAALRGGFQRALRRNLRLCGDVLQEAMTASAAHGMQHELKRDNS